MEKVVQTILPTKLLIPKLKKVCAYARVSSGKDAMINSLSAQISYYSEYIQSNREWEYAGVYADEELTGTKDSRPEFQKMITDCKAGKIDMIITKSISRFARNTVTLLETVRELKNLGVDVYFEKENIHSMSGDGELMLTILASFAQEESLSVSENCKWRIRNDFKEGKPNTFSLYGYRKENGIISIYEPEAKVVRDIYNLYLSGAGGYNIANHLNSLKILSPDGGEWGRTSVIGILKNKKYMGYMFLQKSFTQDHLKKKKIKNDGELPQYYVQDSHPAIISREIFEEVQRIFESKTPAPPVSKEYDFKSIVFCGECGNRYIRKKNYKKYVWRCNVYQVGGAKKCPSKQVPDSILKEFAERFEKEIEKIIVYNNNKLKYVFTDGSEETVTWEMPSRKWTDEMKAKNYYNQRRRYL